MDTKSKNFSRSFFARFIAVALLTALTLPNAFMLAKLARGVILFGVPALTAAAEPVTETNAFASATQSLIRNLCEQVNAQRLSTPEYVEKKRAEIETRYAQATALYNEIIEDYNICTLRDAQANGDTAEPQTTMAAQGADETAGEAVTAPVPQAAQTTKVAGRGELATAVETYVYYVYHGEHTDEEDENYGEPAKRIVVKRGEVGYWYYQFCESHYPTSSGSAVEAIESFAANASGYSRYADELAELDGYGEKAEYLSEYFAGLDSVDFFIAERKTGEYFTNLEGCETEAAAAQALRSSAWYSFFSNETFETNDTREYSGKGDNPNDVFSAPAFSFGKEYANSGYYESNNIPINKSDFTAASPFYWFLQQVGRASAEGKADDDYAIYIGFSGSYGGSDAFAKIYDGYSEYTGQRYLAIGILSLACLMLFASLIAVAGKDEDGKCKKYTVDRLWNDVHLVISGGLLVGVAALVVGLGINFFDVTFNNPNAFAAVCAVGFTLCVLLLLEWLTSVARHVRAKTYIRHTLCAWCVILCWKFIKLCFRPVVRLFRMVKEIGGVKHLPRWVVAACLGVIAVNMLFVGSAVASRSGVPVFFALLFDAGVVGVFFWIFISLDKIMGVVSDTKNGRLNSKVDVKNTFPLLREFAANVNCVGNGLQAAVDSALKDQRMKAELITNVSHDLKTPLTSIVSYVDLLKRCEVEDEQARKYIDILDEKSQRMKKLIEDLVEASKVSSGAVELHPMRLNLCELAVQAVGENSEILEKSAIELRYRMPEQPVYIMADGQKTSRIIENLFSNVQKYAMPETRVYAEVLTDGKFGALTIKNVSRYPLDVSAEELTQRFVRGDAARSSEGSGLGLSIAKNLCELQGGRCIIYVDGDLFKVTILLPMA